MYKSYWGYDDGAVAAAADDDQVGCFVSYSPVSELYQDDKRTTVLCNGAPHRFGTESILPAMGFEFCGDLVYKFRKIVGLMIFLISLEK